MAENNDENINVIVVYKTYTQSQKRAIKNYVQKNREKYNEYQKERYAKLKENPDFMQKKRESSKKSYNNKKIKNTVESLNEI